MANHTTDRPVSTSTQTRSLRAKKGHQHREAGVSRRNAEGVRVSRDIKLQVWVSEEEKVKWEKQAMREELTLAAWARRAMHRALAVESVR